MAMAVRFGVTHGGVVLSAQLSVEVPGAGLVDQDAEECRYRAVDFGRLLLQKQFSYLFYYLISNSYLMSSSENKRSIRTVFLSVKDQAEIGVEETNYSHSSTFLTAVYCCRACPEVLRKSLASSQAAFGRRYQQQNVSVCF